MKKILKRVAIVVVVLVIAVVLAVSLFLDHIVKKGVETVGPELTKVSVKLEGVNLSMFSGSGTINGLEVGNPEGYKSPIAIKLGSASLAVAPGSLLSDKIVIKHIRVKSPEITIEGSPKNNNLTKILENVQASAGGSDAKSGSSEPAEEGASKKLQVDEFLLTDAKVNYIVAGQTFALKIPDIKLTDLGSGPDGITSAEMTDKVLSKLMDELLPVLLEQGEAIGKQAVDTAVDKATKGISDLFKQK